MIKARARIGAIFRAAHRPSARGALAAAVIATVVLVGAFPADSWAKRKSKKKENSSPFSESCSAERAGMKAAIDDILRVGEVGGPTAIEGPDVLFDRHPLLTTFAWEVYRHDRDAAFLRAVHRYSTLHANELLSTADGDGDFLLERATWTAGHTRAIEDVGFNALFALDLLSLSQICRELNKPIEALFWYHGSKVIVGQIVSQMYDADSRYFLPMNNEMQKRENLYFALSAMPAYFSTRLGDNIPGSILRNYVLKNQYLKPETPLNYLNWELAADELSGGVTSEYMLRALLLLGALEWNGLRDDASRLAEQISWQVRSRMQDGNLYANSQEKPYMDYFACLIESRRYGTLFPRHHDLRMLEALGTLQMVMPGEDLHKLRTSANTIESFLAGGDTQPAVDDVQQSIRAMYWTISSLRKRWKLKNLFTTRERDAVPGFDLYAATSDLMDDVVISLKAAETELNHVRNAETGLRVEARLEKDVVAPGEAMAVRVAVSTLHRQVEIKSMLIYHNQMRDTLVSASPPLVVNPRVAPLEYHYRYPAPTGVDAAIVPVRFTIDVQTRTGMRFRYFFNKSVFVMRPISFEVSFPAGRILKGFEVPLQIDITKHVREQVVIHTEWYSPSGLKAKEGPALELAMPPNSTTARMDLNILVPDPCRPGSFPMLLKIFGNGEDYGTVRTSLFRHYQWLFVGPFPATDGGLRGVQAPEQGVNLRQTYKGIDGETAWAALADNALGDDGEIDLATLLPEGSIGYLYTVIKLGWEKRIGMTFNASSPAVVFVNGEEIFRQHRPDADGPKRVTLLLQRGMNNILVKLAATDTRKVFLQLGDENEMTPDEFNNNLWELVDGYQDLHDRAQVNESARVVTLTYHDPGANAVSVIGSFNGWSPVHSRMRRGATGEWEISLHLPPGRYVYRFLVNNNLQILDPRCPVEEPDGYGGKNSVLFVRQ